MTYYILPLIIIAIVATLIYVWLKKSPKFDKFCKALTSDDPVEVTAKSKIKDITSTEKDLSKQVEEKTKKAAKLEQEAEGINDFLGKRGFVEVAEKKEDS